MHGYYPYEIEENYFTEEKLETKPGVYRGGGWNDFAKHVRSAQKASCPIVKK